MKSIIIFYQFLAEILHSRKIIVELARKDFQTKYLGSLLGIIWGFVQPTVNILIFWFVFQVGFKSAPVDNFPFILWLLCGIIPWFFILDGISNGTNAIIDNSYLVKKIVFRVTILPIVKILSSLFIHVFFIILLFIIFLLYGYEPNLYNIQIIYYLFATIILVLAITWITSSLIVFLKDIGHFVNMVLQIFFWLTPIFWSTKIIPQKYYYVLKFNPIFYIVEGYRNMFINNKWFWEDWQLTIIFWSMTLTLFIFGAIMFRKLKPHFADVI